MVGKNDQGAAIVHLRDGADHRITKLLDALVDTINECGKELHFATVLGALRLLEQRLIENQRSAP